MTATSEEDVEDIRDVRVWFGRLEAKLDVALAQHGARLDEHGRRVDDHEIRLRHVEKTAVTRAALAATIATVVAAVGAAVPFLDRLYGGR